VLADMALPVDGSPVVPRVTLLATGAGDPYLPEGPPPEPGEIVLSAPLAGALGVEGARARVEALLDAPPGEAEGAAMSFAVTGRTEAGVWGRMGALLHPDDLFAIQDWTHGGIASGDLDAVRGTRAEREAYPSLRIYAADADGAFRVMDRLAARGVPTGGTPGTAAELVSLRDALDTGFVTVAAVALAGVAATLSATLWMAVIRNRRPLSLLRLGGLPRRGAMLIPVTQALAIGAMGWAISILAYAAMTGLLDRLLADTLGVEGRLARLRWPELAASGGATLAVCALAAVWAATAVTAITPEEGFGDAT
jgi:putative ABC transport system permease protein